MKKQEIPKIRCAIYTRKSTEEGLEQEFNSLDAQRESAEAYITSQKSQGWICLPQYYDDGGFTGGNMKRPALDRLLSDIAGGKVDCVVVYKVDRLSRSLIDFSKILDVFEKHNVSFVSVTQQFNTSSSMGRLTLNILFSFAQFEREVISERTRDKIAMARKKGKFSGGRPVLGYDIASAGGKLIINDLEAVALRRIFQIYLQEQSLIDTLKIIKQESISNKRWITRKGLIHENAGFSRSTLHSLLTNPIYIGKVKYRDKIYDGEHERIIDEQLFKEVGDLLKSNGRAHSQYGRNKYGSLLRGLLYCTSCGCSMSHSFSTRGSRRYHYYVCRKAQTNGWNNCSHPSLPAKQIEDFVIEELRTIGNDERLIEQVALGASELANQKLTKLKNELGSLSQSKVALERRLAELAVKGSDPGVLDKLAITQGELRLLREKIIDTTVQIEEVDGLKGQDISHDHVKQALHEFSPVWENLTPKERGELLRLVVERIDFNGETNSVEITFHPTGIKALSQNND